jgi:iron(III) transport system substrate-binding protein
MENSMIRRSLTSLAAVIFLQATALAAEINIYTTRESALIDPLLKAYSETSGVKFNLVFMKDGLAERVAAEGQSSPADILMAVDAGNLIDLVAKDLAQPMESNIITKSVPASLRGPNNEWISLSKRARVIYAAKDVALDNPTYESLADPKWAGQICIRSGQHPYNTALVAAYIAHHGAEKAETWLTAIKDNLARKPSGGDRDVAKDILGGICKIGIANSYYVGLMRSGKGGPEQKPWGDAINVYLPQFEDGGTHVNISGAVLAKYSPNKDEAVKFLEFLVSPEAQKVFAEANFEYPVTVDVKVDPLISALGDLTADERPLSDILSYRKQASDLIEKVGFDN